MHVLLTRPERQGQRTAAALRALGHQVIHAPLLRIVSDSGVDLGERPYAGIVVTSANALDAMAKHPQRESLLNVPVLAVGERTAEAAREAGFANVVSVNGDVARLADVVTATIPRGSRVLYLAGANRAGDLAGLLQTAGYSVHMAEIYRAVAADTLPGEVIQAFRSDTIDAVLHYSRRSAETFLRLAAAGSCLINVLKCKHFCLSTPVAEPLAAAGAKDIHVARRPEETALLALVGNN